VAVLERSSKIQILRRALIDLLHEHERDEALPTSARFLFYELVQRQILSKEKTGARRPEQNMLDALMDIREDGRVPWSWITDETREVENYAGYRSIREGVLATLPHFYLDCWNGSPPLILTESRSLAGVLRGIAREYRVRIASTNGQVGGFLRTEVAPLLKPHDVVGYLGDFDRAGGQIEDNTRRVLEREIGGELDWTRIALTAQQVEEYDLPQIIKHDRRYKDGGAHWAVETEALRQTVLMDILRAWLEARLPEPLVGVQEREARERQHIERILRQA
jgi:hypothetical protein